MLSGVAFSGLLELFLREDVDTPRPEESEEEEHSTPSKRMYDKVGYFFMVNFLLSGSKDNNLFENVIFRVNILKELLVERENKTNIIKVFRVMIGWLAKNCVSASCSIENGKIFLPNYNIRLNE